MVAQHIPTLQSHNSKSGTILTFSEDGDSLLDACTLNTEEAIMLTRVSKLIRKEIFERNYQFNGSLCGEQYDDLPPFLTTLVGMILGDYSTKQNHDNASS